MKSITVTGARVHNLRNVDVSIPRNALVVITGVSGSGKTSLAFDTIFAEGQRRYFETLSAYSRQFVQEIDRPDVDLIEGLSPSISVNQKGLPSSPRSTVGTLTEIYDYLRLFYTAAGTPVCPDCDVEIKSTSVERIAELLIEKKEGAFVYLTSPLVVGRKGIYKDLIEKVARRGFTRVRVDGEMFHVDDRIEMSRYKIHNIDLVIDRLEITQKNRSRILESLVTCAREGKGGIGVHDRDGDDDLKFNARMSCPSCGYSPAKLSPRLFSFNHPAGACPACKGTGDVNDFDPARLIPDPGLSIMEGAIVPLSLSKKTYNFKMLSAGMAHAGVDLDEPVGNYSKKAREQLFNGIKNKKFRVRYRSHGGSWKFATASFDGVFAMLRGTLETTTSDRVREKLTSYLHVRPCFDCDGARLGRDALSVKIHGYNIAELATMPIDKLGELLDGLELTDVERAIGGGLLREVQKRIGFMMDVGLSYLSLNRKAMTLSGGEYQRVRLASQIGTYLAGVTYVLDEPSVGLHARDGQRLLDTLERLRDLGNSVLVVEHDEFTINRADHVIDLGPGAGRLGGEIVARGTPKQVARVKESLTGRYLSGDLEVTFPTKRRTPGGDVLRVSGATGNNLKNLKVDIPLGLFVCVTGVSGSGKSTLAIDTLMPAVQKELDLKHKEPLPYKKITGAGSLKRAMFVDASPIGKTPRSTPATYIGLFDDIRKIYAALPESRARGYKLGRFSYNVKGGRCEACQGNGARRVEMHFLPDVFVKCDVCKGRRYNNETLEVTFKGKSIADVLEMTAEEAYPLFKNIPRISRKLKITRDIGLDYLLLGQPAPTLSSGEAQRMKLAAELQLNKNDGTLYLLDEPTKGLHFSDIQKLVDIINRLVEMGNTVVVVEHNMDVIKCADWIIDLGPEGGEEGGRIISQGPPEKIARSKKSHTGRFLKEYVGSGTRGKNKN